MSDEICICGAAPPKDAETREPVDGRCPLCTGVLEIGFGLAGGGYGPYWGCVDCDYFFKEFLGEEADDA